MIFGACQSCEAPPLQCPYLEIAIAKKLVVDKYENDTHAPVYYQYDTYVAEFHKKRKMYTSSVAVADK
jgi:hypothetical protein